MRRRAQVGENVRIPAKRAAKRVRGPSSTFPEILRGSPTISQRYSQRSPGPTGMLIPDRPFPPALRRDLEKVLRRVRPRLDASAMARIIHQLREADDVVTVLRASLDPASIGGMLDALSRAATPFRRALEATIAHGLLDDAKARLRYASDLERRLLEGLDMLAELTAAARPKKRRPKGGHPEVGAGLALGVQVIAPRWFAAQVAAVLRDHGAQPSQHLDGWFADLLRMLWPHVLRSELPSGDIRRLLRFACLTD
jgi:hypothetical protein